MDEPNDRMIDIDAQAKRARCALEAGDYLESARLFEPLAAEGSEQALLSLAWMYDQGLLGPADAPKAMSLWEKAASLGSTAGTCELARSFYEMGELERARTLFLRTAEKDYTPGMYWAGKMLVRGEGGDADTATGIALLARAAQQGHIHARRALLGIEIRGSRTVFGWLWGWCKVTWLTMSALPVLARDPSSDKLR